jgi:hypothetical protein
MASTRGTTASSSRKTHEDSRGTRNIVAAISIAHRTAGRRDLGHRRGSMMIIVIVDPATWHFQGLSAKDRSTHYRNYFTHA